MAISCDITKKFPEFYISVKVAFKEEMVVLFGPSGSGKSSVLNMISGILQPDTGSIKINEKDIFDSRKGINVPVRRRKIGYVFQDLALFPHMTVFDNIAYGIKDLQEKEIDEKVKDLLVTMRLVGLEERYPSEISGGQRQRVALARTLITEPELLLLDEPFSALDYPVREKLRSDLITIHKRYPITTIVVTHDHEEAYVLGEKIAVMNEGCIEQIGTKEEIFYTPETRQVAKLLGVRNIFEGVIAAINDSEVSIKSSLLGLIKVHHTKNTEQLMVGEYISFGIRPEEIMILRDDRRGPVDNIFDGTVTEIVEKGSQNTIFLNTKDGKGVFKIDMPRYAYKKMGIYKGMTATASLKKECIWIAPTGKRPKR
jgi:molybdate transport system ATP-binding protein